MKKLVAAHSKTPLSRSQQNKSCLTDYAKRFSRKNSIKESLTSPLNIPTRVNPIDPEISHNSHMKRSMPSLDLSQSSMLIAVRGSNSPVDRSRYSIKDNVKRLKEI